MDFDVFVSHASEDKADVARPLVSELQKLGLDVWFDEFELTIGHSLRQSIDKGLANSRFGIVILSPDFFKKEWPNKELDGLVAREDGKEKVILPIWHNVAFKDVTKFSPLLAGRFSISTKRGIQEVARHVLRAVKKESVPTPTLEQTKSRKNSTRLKIFKIRTLFVMGLVVIGTVIGYSRSAYVSYVRSSFSDSLNKFPLSELNKKLNESLTKKHGGKRSGPDHCEWKSSLAETVCVGTAYTYSTLMGEISIVRDADNRFSISVPLTISGSGRFTAYHDRIASPPTHDADSAAGWLGLKARGFTENAQAHTDIYFSMENLSCVKPIIRFELQWPEGSSAYIADKIWIDIAKTVQPNLNERLQEINQLAWTEIMSWIAHDHARYVSGC